MITMFRSSTISNRFFSYLYFLTYICNFNFSLQIFPKNILKRTSIAKDLNSYPFVILPGFGNDYIDYINPLEKGESISIVNTLKKRGIKNISVVPIKRIDWLNIIFAIFSVDFWRNQCKPDLLFSFYFKAVDLTVRDVCAKYDKPVVLIGHSAGGWLARSALSNGCWMGIASNNLTSQYVAGLVTLGSPHYPPIDSTVDMTRGAIQYVDKNFPGAYLKRLQNIFYITVAGSVIQGNSSAEKGSIEKFASNSYLQVTGDSNGKGEERGDGVVPVRFAHLDDAVQITISDSWHSIQAPNNMWYGGDKVIDKWLQPTLSSLQDVLEKREKNNKL